MSINIGSKKLEIIKSNIIRYFERAEEIAKKGDLYFTESELGEAEKYLNSLKPRGVYLNIDFELEKEHIMEVYHTIGVPTHITGLMDSLEASSKVSALYGNWDIGLIHDVLNSFENHETTLKNVESKNKAKDLRDTFDNVCVLTAIDIYLRNAEEDVNKGEHFFAQNNIELANVWLKYLQPVKQRKYVPFSTLTSINRHSDETQCPVDVWFDKILSLEEKAENLSDRLARS